MNFAKELLESGLLNDHQRKAIQQMIDASSSHRQERAGQLEGSIATGEPDTIRRQIEACWNLPAGARDAQNMVIKIRVKVDPDGRVRSATIVDRKRATNDRFFRSMAESAVRAVLNPRCQPLQLDKPTEGHEIVISLDPQEMF